MAKSFLFANSSVMDCLDTAFTNWEYTQPWSVSFWHKPSGNLGGSIVSKAEGSVNFRGWEAFARTGTSLTQYAGSVTNSVPSALRATTRTTNEFASGVWHHVVVTYTGSGTVAGFHIYVDNVDQALTAISDTLAGNTILTSVNLEIGARGGTGASANFLTGDLSEVLIYNVVLTVPEVATLNAQSSIVSRGLQCWMELSDLGATLQPDWSGNGQEFSINFAQAYLAGPSADTLPQLGRTGPASISGPLTRNPRNPILQNLGWAGGANAGTADQIGPGEIIKFGYGDYRGWFENEKSTKTLDAGNQPGAFDFDTPTIYGTSIDGTVWTLQNQDVPASALITCNNLTTNPAGNETAFKAAVQGETSLSSIFYDQDDLVWKAWMHGGNNTGPRKIYYLKCTGGTGDPAVAGNWVVQNNGVAVVSTGSGGSDDELWLADAKVVRVNSSLMVMTYLGVNVSSAKQILQATSTDRGLTWTKNGRAVTPGAAGTWDAVVQAGGGGFVYIQSAQVYALWYGAAPVSTTDGEGIGFAYATDPTVIPFTKGAYNPVLCKKDRTSGTNNLENSIANTISTYIDNDMIRIWYRADNGVSGATAFRGRNEAFIMKPRQMVNSNNLRPRIFAPGLAR